MSIVRAAFKVLAWLSPLGVAPRGAGGKGVVNEGESVDDEEVAEVAEVDEVDEGCALAAMARHRLTQAKLLSRRALDLEPSKAKKKAGEQDSMVGSVVR